MPQPLVLALVLSLLGCLLPGLAIGSDSRPRSALANAPGLEKRITYSETKIPLGELVAKVAADTGVALTAAREVAEEPVAVVVTEFPARELLEQLAELLDYRWSLRSAERGVRSAESPGRSSAGTPHSAPRTPRSYEIWQDLASKQREEALRQALFAAVEERFQEEMALCRELAGKSQVELQRLWEERTRWSERLQKLTPLERRALENSPEGQRARRYRWLGALWSPIQRALAGWTLRLPPEQWAILRAGRPLIFSSDPRRGELPLPPDVLRVFRTSRPLLPPPGRPEREAQQRQEEWKRQERWSQAAHYRVSLRFDQRPPLSEAMTFPVLARPFGPDVPSVPWYEEPIFTLGASAGDVIATVEEDSRRRAALEQDPVLSVRKPFQPDPRPYVDPVFPGTSRTFRFLPEYLPELVRAYGVHVIADSYWCAARPSGVASMGGTTPLFEVLDRLAGADHAWDRHGKLIRIRDRKWFLDRPSEIPLRLVRRWVAVTDRLGALPLAEFASAAATLTDVQLEALRRIAVFPPQLDDLFTPWGRVMEKSRHLLRLYAQLSPVQRQALSAGKPLSVAELSPALRRLVLAALYRITLTTDQGTDLEQWGDGHITFTRTPDVRIRERRGQTVAYRLESQGEPRAGTRPDAVTRFPVSHLEMRIHYGPQKSYALPLIVAAEPGDSAEP